MLGAGANSGSARYARSARGVAFLLLALSGLSVRAQEPFGPRGGTPTYSDVTSQAGISFVGTTGSAFDGLSGDGSLLQRNMGNGAAVGDYDADGDLDIYLLGYEGFPNVLLRNELDLGLKSFSDVTANAGVGDLGLSRVAHFVDLDNDGWLDLLLLNDDDGSGLHSPSRIFRNDRDGTFTDVTAGSGFGAIGFVVGGASLADYDLDGLLDIYVTNWGMQGSGPRPVLPGMNRLYRNLGRFRFEDVTASAGLGTVRRDAFTSIFTDFNGDLRPDLLIAFDFTTDKFYWNTPAGFLNATAEVNTQHTGNDMGLACADFDDDGDLDVYSTNVTDPAREFGTSSFNVLYLNRFNTLGTTRFINRAEARGVQDTFWGWGVEFVDAENDGDLDIVAVSGFDELVFNFSGPESPIYQTPSVFFLNDGTGNFARPNTPGLESPDDSRALIAFDYDRDGDEDLLITNVNQPARLLENITLPTGHWLDVAVFQLPGLNRFGVGATVRATVSGVTKRREILAGESYLAGTPQEVHFGLGAATVVEELRVAWTDGRESVYTAVPADQFLAISQVDVCDCDGNGTADGPQIAADPNQDADQDGILDTCQQGNWDCNGNGFPDVCEPDCNGSGAPDDCDVDPADPDGDGVVSADCDGNGVPDSCDLARSIYADCNVNGVPDQCDVSSGASPDVNGNAVPDECDPDCDGNGLLDELEIAAAAGLDQNHNTVLDACEVIVPCADPIAAAAGAGAAFAQRVALAGDTAAIGAPLDDALAQDAGAVRVYAYNGGTWGAPVTLTAFDGVAGDQFGSALALYGDVLVVGASHASEQRGAVYVYRLIAGTWTFEVRLSLATSRLADRFGYSVAVFGETVAVGVLNREQGTTLNAGAAYVFRFDGATWIEEAQLAAPAPERIDHFGSSVALNGPLLLVGARDDDEEIDSANSGSAYAYRFDGSTWNFEARLTADRPDVDQRFGDSIAMLDDLAVVGAPRFDAGANNAGAAFVFRRDPNAPTWRREALLTASDAGAGDLFGSSLALSTNRVIVGAPGDTNLGANAAGSVYVFEFDGSTWVERVKLDSGAPAAGDAFGTAVGIMGDAVVIGAPGVDEVGTDAGGAFVVNVVLSDCNTNGVSDACDIASGGSHDTNANGVPDECCPGDADGADGVNLTDLAIVLAKFDQPITGPGDVDGDGDIDIDDLLTVLDNFGRSCR